MTKNILVVAAHPDDEVLGCGGTIARLTAEGNEVHIVILGEGITSRYEDRKKADKKELEVLKEKAKNASEIMGASKLILENLPDNRFDTIPLLDIVHMLEKIIEETGPEIVFTHASSDLNIDHKITHRAVLTAARPIETSGIRELYAFEVPSSTEWASGQFGEFTPDTFYDITGTIESKLNAMETYESETKQPPHPRSAESLRALAQNRGSAAGLSYAEAFETIRRII